MGSRTAFALAVAVVLAGCLGGPRSGEVTLPGASADAPAPGTDPAERTSRPAASMETWSFSGETRLGWLAGAGAPGLPYAGVKDACTQALVHVPNGTRELRVSHVEEIVDAREPGAGHFGVAVHDANGDFVRNLHPGGVPVFFEGGDLVARAPLPGSWSLHFWMLGPQVNQHADLTITLEGEGEAAPAWDGVVGGDC